MNTNKLFNEVFEESRKSVLMNKMTNTLSTDSQLLSQLHKSAICNPSYSVDHILRLNNCSYNQYLNLIKSGFSIPQIRKLHLGKTRELTGAEKEQITARLHKGSFKPKRKKSKSPSKKYGSGEIDASYLLNKMKDRKTDFDLDNA